MPKDIKTFDLEEVVKAWAWRLFDDTASWLQKRQRRKQRRDPTYIILVIDWCDAKFTHETIWDSLDDDSKATSNQITKSGTAVGPSEASQVGMSILFHTRFTNTTDHPQEYTMKTEKTTSSSCSTSFETCFTRGFEMSVCLKTPGEIFEANAGYKREMSLTKSEGETVEETVTWGVESTIRVKEKHIAEAHLVVNERKKRGDFTVVTRIAGMVFVDWHKRSDNKILKATGHNIAEILKEYLDLERRKGTPLDFVTIENATVVIRNKGTCRFRYGVNQDVKVYQKPIPSS